MRKNYFSVWRTFNNFVISLDRKPTSWEDRLTLFVGYLVNDGKKASTIKSYVSAIKAVLMEIKVELTTDMFLITSLTHACRLINDHVRTHLPILKGQLNMILKQAVIRFQGQPFLTVLKAIMSLKLLMYKLGSIRTRYFIY